jgi:hypothetical protein
MAAVVRPESTVHTAQSAAVWRVHIKRRDDDAAVGQSRSRLVAVECPQLTEPGGAARW